MINACLELGATLAQVIIWICFMTKFFSYKEERKVNILYTTVFVVILTASAAWLNYIIPYEGILSALIIMIMFIYCRICLQGKISNQLFMSIFSVSIIFSVASIFLLIVSIAEKGLVINSIIGGGMGRKVVLIGCRVFEIIIFATLLKMKKNYKLSDKEWLLFTAMSVMTWFAVIILVNASIKADGIEPYMLGIVLIIVIINIIIYYFILIINREREEAEELSFLKIKYDSAVSAERNMRDLYKSVNSLHHDLSKHMTALRAMAKSSSSDEICGYIDNVFGEEIKGVYDIALTDNDVFNAIINTRLEVCHTKNIVSDIGVEEGILSCISNEDISVLFGNLLDNAIEAAEKAEKRIIELKIKGKGEHISICMANSYKKLPDKNMTSTKNKPGHGYGVGNIKRIVSKYGGTIEFSNNDNRFFVNIMMKKNKNYQT